MCYEKNVKILRNFDAFALNFMVTYCQNVLSLPTK